MDQSRLFWILTLAVWVLTLFLPVASGTNIYTNKVETLYVGHAYLGIVVICYQGIFLLLVIPLFFVALHCGASYLIAMGLTFCASFCWPQLDPKQSDPVSIPWYRRDQYGLLLEQATDRDDLEPTYEAWERKASAIVRELQARGTNLAKVDVDVQELARWCQQHGHSLDAKARSQFARHLVGETARRGHNLRL